VLRPSSSKSLLRYITFLATSDRVQYSALVDDRIIVGYSLLDQEIGAEPSLYKMPDVER
jgi:hypothetical protein